MTTSVLTDWNDQPLRVARSRGGVLAICDVRRALLYDEAVEWPPPALRRKLKRSKQISAFDPPGSVELQERLGFYCDLQSITSEDAISWSFFGPFLTVPPEARAKLLNWLVDLAGVAHQANTACEIRLWHRLPHPDTGRSSHGPEPDLALDGDRAIGLLYVRRQWTRSNEYGPTKTAAGVRRIPLPKELAMFFRELKLRSGASADDDPVFASKEGTALGHRNVTRRGFEPAVARAGIENVTFHDMRHAFASRMIARGIEPVTLAKLMGHEDIRETLNTYTDLWDRVRTDEAVRQAMAL